MADAPDALSQAQSQISAQKAATLAAIAKAGSQGAQQYQAALAGNSADKTAALQGQLSNLGAVGAPAVFQAQEQAKLSQPLDLASANLASQGQARQDFLSNLGATSGTYFDEANAAVPAMRAAAHNALLAANAKLADAANSSNIALQLKELELQQAQAKANPAATVSGALASLGSTAGEQGANLYGLGQQQNAADTAAQTGAMGNLSGFSPGAAGVVGAIANAYPTVAAPSQGDTAATIQALNQRLAELGASGAPGYVAGETPNASGFGSGGVPNISAALADQIYGSSQAGQADQAAVKAAAASPTSAAQVDAIRSSPQYKEAAPRYTQALSSVGQKGGAPSVAAVDNQLIATYGPDIARQVMADFGRATSAYQAPVPVG